MHKYVYVYPGLSAEHARLEERRRLAEANNMHRKRRENKMIIKKRENNKKHVAQHNKKRNLNYLLSIYPHVHVVPTRIGNIVIQKSQLVKMIREMNSKRSWFNRVRKPIPKIIKNNMSRFY